MGCHGVDGSVLNIKPFRLDMRVRNNVLLRAIEALGFQSVYAFAKATGLAYESINCYVSLRKSPLRVDTKSVTSCVICARPTHPNLVVCLEHRTQNDAMIEEHSGELPWVWRKFPLRLADFLGVDPGDLWPECLRRIANAKRVAVEIDEMQAQHLSQIAAIECKELKEGIQKQLSTLSDREQRVIRQRFGFGCEPKTLREIGKSEGLTAQSIQQIEDIALRRLRQGDGGKRLRQIVEGTEVEDREKAKIARDRAAAELEEKSRQWQEKNIRGRSDDPH